MALNIDWRIVGWGDGMRTEQPGIGEGTTDSRWEDSTGESQAKPLGRGRYLQGETGTWVARGEFVLNLPEAAHVASTAPPAARFGAHFDFQTEAAMRFSAEGIERGDRVVIIGSRWQYLDILRALQALMDGMGPRRTRSPWRNRDLSVFEANEVQSEVLVNDMPDEVRFASFVERACQPAQKSRNARVWNNLGARFHESGNTDAAGAIEHLWERVRRRLRYTIMCGYSLPDPSSRDTISGLGKPLEPHTHVIRPTPEGVAVEPVPKLT